MCEIPDSTAPCLHNYMPMDIREEGSSHPGASEPLFCVKKIVKKKQEKNKTKQKKKKKTRKKVEKK